jgi:hypothetical protein
MARQDLLALTTDDLITLANAGLVKRAQKEIESGDLTYTLVEDQAGTVEVNWSDSIRCVLPGGATLRQSRCSCPATGLCRHLLRSALVYQKEQTGQPPTPPTPAAAAPPPVEAGPEPAFEATALARPGTEHPTLTASLPTPGQPWDPGAISDETLTGLLKKSVLSQARLRFDQGQVLDVTRSTKPTAHIHTLGCTIRFLVAGDARYTHCDCSEEAPCSHVPLAVWAFRLLEPGRSSGLVSTRPQRLPVPTALLAEIERRLADLALPGLSGLPNSLRDHLRRLEMDCREQGLIWPAEIIEEMLQQLERYQTHDARFAPEDLAALLGELVIRARAIRSDTGAIPALFVRGSANDRVTELGAARLVGLGCGVRVLRQSVELSSFMQDLSSGAVVAVRQEFAGVAPPGQPAPEPKPFWQLARASQSKGISLGELGAGQLLIIGAKRSANYQLKLGRAAASLNPQTFQWENLRAPLLAENFSEVQARLAALPPAALRPRRLTENFQVCQVARVEGAFFSATYQAVIARLTDSEGYPTNLIHPFTSRGQPGTEALLAWLNDPAKTLRFVAGPVQPGPDSLILHPVALVFEQAGQREILQPWITPPPAAPATREDTVPAFSGLPTAPSVGQVQRHPASAFFDQLAQALGELLVVGLERADRELINFWGELYRQGVARGFSRGVESLGALVEAFQQKDRQLHWDGRAAALALVDLALLVRLAQEEPGV